MQRQIGHWAAVVVADDGDSLNIKAAIATGKGIDRAVHGVAPVEKDRGTWPPRDACPSWAGKTERLRAAGSPAVVVEYQLGDDLAAFQVETAEIGKPLELTAFEHRAAFTGVVKADHRGKE